MHRLKLAFVTALFFSLSYTAHPQSSLQPSPTPQIPTLTSRSNLVLVPVLVKTKAAKVVLTLTAEDFILTDNGIPQPVRIEDGALGQPTDDPLMVPGTLTLPLIQLHLLLVLPQPFNPCMQT